jgi:hypothetical protein
MGGQAVRLSGFRLPPDKGKGCEGEGGGEQRLMIHGDNPC